MPDADTLARAAQNWAEAAYATGPTDRARAEAGVRAAYTAAGLPGPERVVWVRSPAEGAIAATLIAHGPDLPPALKDRGLAGPLGLAPTQNWDVAVKEKVGASVRDAVRTRPWERARAAASSAQGPELWARTWTRTGGPLWAPVASLVGRIRQSVGDLAGEDGAAARLRAATLDAVLGQHDAAWLCQLDALGHLDDLTGLAEVTRSAGWWWPYERVAIISELPVELHRDDQGRLHRGSGPALSYADGLELHAWRGMPLQPEFARSLSDITVQRIDAETNAEQRRVLLEIFGYDRYLSEIGAKPLHRDETGVLWRIDVLNDEPVVLVEVVNSTPEPDGTYRTYHLRVPPDTRTARAGVAWTFGVSEGDYTPERQT